MTEVGADLGAARPGLLRAMALTAVAGGMGWGIRGQYGHETGAMLAGVLVGYTLIALFAAHSHSLWVRGRWLCSPWAWGLVVR